MVALTASPHNFARNQEEQRKIDEQIQALNLRRNALAPIFVLPPELLSMVFMFACDAGKDFRSAIFITHVCQHWRAIALELSCMWSTPPSRGSECAKEFLKRAKGTPLDVCVTFSHSAKKDDVKAIITLLDEMDHIRSLCLFIHTAFPDAAVLKRLSMPAPILEDVEITNVCFTIMEQITLFGQVTPRLKRVSFVCYSFERSGVSNIFQNLRNLCLIDPFNRPTKENLTLLLEGMPLLESIIVDKCVPMDLALTDVTPVSLLYLTNVEVRERRLIDCATFLAFLGLESRPNLQLTTYLPPAPPDLAAAFAVVEPILNLAGAPLFNYARVRWENSDRFTVSISAVVDNQTQPSPQADFTILLHTSNACPLSLWCKHLPLSGIKTLFLDGFLTTYSVRDFGWLKAFEPYDGIKVLRATRIAVQEVIETLGVHLMHEWDYMEESDDEDLYDSEEDSEGSYTMEEAVMDTRAIVPDDEAEELSDEDSSEHHSGSTETFAATRYGPESDTSKPMTSAKTIPFSNLSELMLEQHDLRDHVMGRSVDLMRVLNRIVEQRVQVGAPLSALRLLQLSGITSPSFRGLKQHVEKVEWVPNSRNKH